MNKANPGRGSNNQTGLTKKVSREAVNAVISAITDSLASLLHLYKQASF